MNSLYPNHFPDPAAEDPRPRLKGRDEGDRACGGGPAAEVCRSEARVCLKNLCAVCLPEHRGARRHLPISLNLGKATDLFSPPFDCGLKQDT